MKKPVFLATHLGSGTPDFMHVLVSSPRVQCYRTNLTYQSPTDLEVFEEKPHKCHSLAAVYIDEIIYNHHMRCKQILNFCQFIYAIREPVPTLNYLIRNKIYYPAPAVRYYCYRIRRLYEMARCTPGAVFLTWDDMATGRGLQIVEDYLMLNGKITHRPEIFVPEKRSVDTFSREQIKTAEKCYDKYLSLFAKINLKKV